MITRMKYACHLHDNILNIPCYDHNSSSVSCHFLKLGQIYTYISHETHVLFTDVHTFQNHGALMEKLGITGFFARENEAGNE